MSSKVEEVARAIREASPSAGRGDSHLRSQMLSEAACLDLARAAIEAMRSMTEPMRIAALRTELPEAGEPPLYEKCWLNMIDAALREEGR